MRQRTLPAAGEGSDGHSKPAKLAEQTVYVGRATAARQRIFDLITTATGRNLPVRSVTVNLARDVDHSQRNGSSPELRTAAAIMMSSTAKILIW